MKDENEKDEEEEGEKEEEEEEEEEGDSHDPQIIDSFLAYNLFVCLLECINFWNIYDPFERKENYPPCYSCHPLTDLIKEERCIDTVSNTKVMHNFVQIIRDICSFFQIIHDS